MPVRINQPIKQTTLAEHFDILFGKYTSFDTFISEARDERAEAEEAHQKDMVSQLDDEIHKNNLVRLVTDVDGTRLDTDNLTEWINLYYTIEPK